MRKIVYGDKVIGWKCTYREWLEQLSDKDLAKEIVRLAREAAEFGDWVLAVSGVKTELSKEFTGVIMAENPKKSIVTDCALLGFIKQRNRMLKKIDDMNALWSDFFGRCYHKFKDFPKHDSNGVTFDDWEYKVLTYDGLSEDEKKCALSLFKMRAECDAGYGYVTVLNDCISAGFFLSDDDDDSEYKDICCLFDSSECPCCDEEDSIYLPPVECIKIDNSVE